MKDLPWDEEEGGIMKDNQASKDELISDLYRLRSKIWKSSLNNIKLRSSMILSFW